MFLPPKVWFRSKKVHQALQRSRKREQSSVGAINDGCEQQSRLFMFDKSTGMTFLIDTGADLSVMPSRHLNKRVKSSDFQLYATNGSVIDTFGEHILCLDLGLRRPCRL